MKKTLSLMLSFIFIFSSLNINTFKAFGASASISKAYGWYEAIHIEWTDDADAENAEVFYKTSDGSQYTSIDSELVRSTSSGGIADIVGISSGTYDIKIVTSDNETLTYSNIDVASHDRSGYSHFNYSDGVGGYNDDGTPKSNAQIIYVDNDNKNTVKLGSYTGIGNILSHASKYSYPIIVRIIGTVDTQTRDADGTKTTDQNNGVVAINGLTDTESSDDSYFNMLDVASGENITIEGIGEDASIEKWGFTFKKCSSIEVRNLNFTLYPEDACSFSGSSSSNSSYKNFWVHNNYFEKGENKYDLTDEQDKGDGDGSSDFSGCRNITYSYNVFENCHKTSLHGGGDSSLQYNSTWHHNYFVSCSSRLPLTRQANLHTYNNYYYSCTTCTDARASAWVFAEANYFDSCTYAFKTTAQATYGDPIVKLYNNVFSSSGTLDSAGTIVTAADRTASISASKGSNTNQNPYPNFDTDSDVFYYDDTNSVSSVEYLTSAETAKSDTALAAGTMKEGSILDTYLSEKSDENEGSVTYTSNVGNTIVIGGSGSTSLTLLPSTFAEGSYSTIETSSDGVFTINGTTKKVDVTSSYINLTGGGSTEATNIGVNITGEATLTIKFFNSGSSDRTLEIKSSDGSFTENATASANGSVDNVNTAAYNITSADTYYIYSKNSGIRITEVTVTYSSGTAYKIGDINMDNIINSVDAALLLRYVSNIEQLTDDQLILANCNDDTYCNTLDVTAILKYIS